LLANKTSRSGSEFGVVKRIFSLPAVFSLKIDAHVLDVHCAQFFDRALLASKISRLGAEFVWLAGKISRLGIEFAR
jgi:hypothetical protein